MGKEREKKMKPSKNALFSRMIFFCFSSLPFFSFHQIDIWIFALKKRAFISPIHPTNLITSVSGKGETHMPLKERQIIQSATREICSKNSMIEAPSPAFIPFLSLLPPILSESAREWANWNGCSWGNGMHLCPNWGSRTRPSRSPISQTLPPRLLWTVDLK